MRRAVEKTLQSGLAALMFCAWAVAQQATAPESPAAAQQAVLDKAATSQPLPTAQQLIAKWRAALHPTAGVKQAVITTHSEEDGIPGEVSESVSRDGFYRRLVVRQPDRSEMLLKTGYTKRLDWNGFLRDVEGAELSRAQAQQFELATLLFGPGKEFDNATVSSAKQGSGVVLTLKAPGGEEVSWTIDPATGLPLASLRPGEDSRIITKYSDWKNVGSVFTAASATVSETEKPDYKWTRESVNTAKAKLDAANLKPSPSDAHLDPNAPPIPFAFEAQHIIFNVSVNGREPIGFIFDTGADQEVLHQGRLKDFGVTTYGQTQTTGGGGTADYLYAKDATFTWPGGSLKNQHVAVIESTGLERALGVKLGGLLGYDFISRFVVEIDYAKKQLILHPPDWQYQGTGAQIPITFDEGIPFTHGSITAGGKEIPAFFVIDFGAQETMTLTSPFVKANDLVHLAGTNRNVNRTAGLENQFFTQQNMRGHIEKLRIGALEVKDIPINMSVNTAGAYASTTFSGTIGQGIYMRYHVFIDYPHKRLILESTEEASKPFPLKQSYGVTVLASGSDFHTYTITAVRPGSPAEADGFKKGDVVTSLDGAPSSSFTLHELRDTLAKEGDKHEVQVVRGGTPTKIDFTVRLISLEK